MQEFEKGTLLFIDGEVWRIVGDYREVDTPIDFELELTTNTDIWDSFRSSVIYDNIKNGSWKIIEQ